MSVKVDKQLEFAKKLSNYLPDGTADGLAEMVIHHKVILRITKPRKSKLGDFRPHTDGKHFHITVNGNLNPFAFLITFVHEFAHLFTFKVYRNRVAPHGQEWKSYFKQLMQPYLVKDIFPDDVKLAIQSYMENIKASSCSDINLQQTLARYDNGFENPEESHLSFISELALGSHFVFNENRIFRLDQKLTKRYKCTELKTGREYVFSPLAKVKPNLS